MRFLSKCRVQRTLQPVQLQLKWYTAKEVQKVTNIIFVVFCDKLWRQRQSSNIITHTEWRKLLCKIRIHQTHISPWKSLKFQNSRSSFVRVKYSVGFINNIQSRNEYTVGSGIKTTNIVSYKTNFCSFSTSILWFLIRITKTLIDLIDLRVL